MKLLNFFKKLIPKKEKKKFKELADLDISQREDYVNQLKLDSDLQKNIDTIQELFGNSFDLSSRETQIGVEEKKVALFSMDGLADDKSIERLLSSLHSTLLEVQRAAPKKKLSLTLIKQILNNKDITVTNSMSEILKELSKGATVILVEGKAKALLCETQGLQTRDIAEPEGEIVIRGPRDGFVENISANTSLLRQRIRVPHLWLQNYELGSLSKNNIVLAYIKGLASEELVAEVKSRLQKINIDAVLESGYIEEQIMDEAISVFPLLKRTERPDIVVSALLEGRVAILTEGSPFCLLLPVTFQQFLHAPDDYYEVLPIGTFIRLLRFFAYTVSILLPGFYVAVVNYHPELIPVDLLLRISATREGLPFPLIVEAFLMEGIFEILREAGLRLPQAIGPAISIVGALILGEAAIGAGLASAPMIVIVALTAISSFTAPDFPFAIAARVLKFFFLILGGSIGLFGIQFGILILLIHLCSLRSFGQPYFQPFAPLIWQDMKDSILRLPHWFNISRPKLIGGQEEQRKKEGQKPQPPSPKKGSE